MLPDLFHRGLKTLFVRFRTIWKNAVYTKNEGRFLKADDAKENKLLFHISRKAEEESEKIRMES